MTKPHSRTSRASADRDEFISAKVDGINQK